jgi:ribonuclease D
MIELTSIVHITRTSELQSIIPQLESASRIAIDTEADSLHHYFEKVCLLQVSVPGLDVIIDPLAEIDLTALLEVLGRKCLIIQGADYDLRMMKRDYDFQATSIFDTMLAAQMLGYERFSYAALVEKHCGVVLSKHGQKADWSQRPLPEKLITYAAADTHYLIEVADKLEQELIAAGRLEWLHESCERLLTYVAEGMRLPDPERQWRVKGWHQLKPGRGWAFLRELWKWRDLEAQRVDFPPFKIMRNETLVEIAQWAQNGFKSGEMPKLPRNIQGRRRREMEEALAVARDMPPSEWPKPLESTKRRLPALNEQLLNSIKTVRDKYATEMQLDPGFLLSAGAIGAIAASKPSSANDLAMAGLFRWQNELMGAEILRAIEQADNSTDLENDSGDKGLVAAP